MHVLDNLATAEDQGLSKKVLAALMKNELMAEIPWEKVSDQFVRLALDYWPDYCLLRSKGLVRTLEGIVTHHGELVRSHLEAGSIPCYPGCAFLMVLRRGDITVPPRWIHHRPTDVTPNSDCLSLAFDVSGYGRELTELFAAGVWDPAALLSSLGAYSLPDELLVWLYDQRCSRQLDLYDLKRLIVQAEPGRGVGLFGCRFWRSLVPVHLGRLGEKTDSAELLEKCLTKLLKVAGSKSLDRRQSLADMARNPIASEAFLLKLLRLSRAEGILRALSTRKDLDSKPQILRHLFQSGHRGVLLMLAQNQSVPKEYLEMLLLSNVPTIVQLVGETLKQKEEALTLVVEGEG